MRRMGWLVLLAALLLGALCPVPVQAGSGTDLLVARVTYTSPAQLAELAARLDVWESHPAQQMLVVGLSQNELDALRAQGLRVELDAAQTRLVNAPRVVAPGQVNGILGYPCYRTVEETYAALGNLTTTYPRLAALQDIGDSWDRQDPGGPAGYDLWLLNLTNQDFTPPQGKFHFFLMAEIHAREYVTAETALRLAETLLAGYGSDADMTWLLDYGEIHILPMSNPDGRKFAEDGSYWRKNTNPTNGCTSSYGVDLNRNSSYKWGDAGTSPCDETYQGPSAASEPETVFIQEVVRSLFPDERGPLDDDPAPADYQGLFITLHSYSELVLFPYGWGYAQAPNHTALQTLARKMAYFNRYTPQKSSALYPASGTTDDWAYGELGLPAYTFEMGTSFFQGCTSFESSIWPGNRAALLAAFKAARRPYQSPAGPEVLNPQLTPANPLPAASLNLTANADDKRYENSAGVEPSQNIAAARCSLDAPSWVEGTPLIPLQAADGSFNSPAEALTGTVDTAGLALGRHTLFIEAQDAAGNWGVPTAVFFTVQAPAAGLAQLTPAAADLVTQPGASTVHSLTLENIGLAQAVFDLAALGAAWPVAVEPLLLTLAPGESAALTVTVQVPPEAAGSDTVQVSAVPREAPDYADSALLTTRLNQTSLTPTASAQSGVPGTQLTYTLTLTSSADGWRTFDVLPGEHTWPVELSDTLIGLMPGQSAALTVTVSIPPDAPDAASESLRVRVEMRADRRHAAEALLSSTAARQSLFIYIPLVQR